MKETYTPYKITVELQWDSRQQCSIILTCTNWHVNIGEDKKQATTKYIFSNTTTKVVQIKILILIVASFAADNYYARLYVTVPKAMVTMSPRPCSQSESLVPSVGENCRVYQDKHNGLLM